MIIALPLIVKIGATARTDPPAIHTVIRIVIRTPVAAAAAVTAVAAVATAVEATAVVAVATVVATAWVSSALVSETSSGIR